MLPGRMTDAVIFDMDGVILDTERVWDEVREDLTRERGGTWHPGAQRDMMGMSSQEWPVYMAERLEVPMTPPAILETVGDELIRRYRDALPLLPGAAAAVRRMAGARPLGLASSSPLRVILAALELAGIRDCFAAVVSSEEVGRGKPAPDVYLEAAARLGVAADRCWAVEDSTNGIRSAVAAGMRVVVIPNPDYPPHPDAVGAAHLVVTAVAGLTPDLLAA